MRKFIVLGAGAVGAAGVSAAVFGSAVASAAPDLTGALYKDAKTKLASQGYTPIVATRIGDRVEDDKCVVDRIQDANFTNGTGHAAAKTVYVYLNCYANLSSQYTPGYSLQSPQGAAVKAAEDKAAADAAAQAAAEQQAQSEASVTAQNQH